MNFFKKMVEDIRRGATRASELEANVVRHTDELRAAGKLAEAQSELAAVLAEVAPATPLFLCHRLGQVLAELGQLEAAAKQLERAAGHLASHDDEKRAKVEILRELGDVLRRCGRTRDAASQLRRALGLADQVCPSGSREPTEVALALARIYLETNAPRDAKPLLTRAVQALRAASDPREAETQRQLDATLATLGESQPGPAPQRAPEAAPPAPTPAPTTPTTPEGRDLAARMTRGDVARERVELAAYAGHAAARDALGSGEPCKLRLAAPKDWFHPTIPVEPDALDLGGWVSSAWRWPEELATRLALAAATSAAPAWEQAASDLPVHALALGAARRFIAAPGPTHREELSTAYALCTEAAKKLAPEFKRGGKYLGYSSGGFLAATCLRVLDAPGDRTGVFSLASSVAEEAAQELGALSEKEEKAGKARRRAHDDAPIVESVKSAAIAWALGHRTQEDEGVARHEKEAQRAWREREEGLVSFYGSTRHLEVRPDVRLQLPGMKVLVSTPGAGGPGARELAHAFVTHGLTQAAAARPRPEPTTPPRSGYGWELALEVATDEEWVPLLLGLLASYALESKPPLDAGHRVGCFLARHEGKILPFLGLPSQHNVRREGTAAAVLLWPDLYTSADFEASSGDFGVLLGTMVTEEEWKLAQGKNTLHVLLLLARMGVGQRSDPYRKSVTADYEGQQEWREIAKLEVNDVLAELYPE
jgi:tetratricopeptide (TPR) repeat protein